MNFCVERRENALSLSFPFHTKMEALNVDFWVDGKREPLIYRKYIRCHIAVSFLSRLPSKLELLINSFDFVYHDVVRIDGFCVVKPPPQSI